jgi:uncharacterized RDD family membrane protein YckC
MDAFPREKLVRALGYFTLYGRCTKNFSDVVFNVRRSGRNSVSNIITSQEPEGWATFRLRFRAFLIDAGICLGLFLIGGLIAGALFETNPIARVVSFLFIVGCILSYEPFMVSRYGGTFGHMFLNLRIVRVQSQANLSVWRAFVRTITKLVFGVFSFVFMFVTNRAQALHDLAARSEVRIRHRERATAADYFTPTLPIKTNEHGPSRLRRVIGILLYSALLFLVTVVVWSASASSACIQLDICTPAERQSLDFLVYFWLIGCCVAITLGWTGRLPGFRRRGA